jgi:hypothetical protein
MFTGGMKEETASVIDLPDMDSNLLKMVCSFELLFFDFFDC